MKMQTAHIGTLDGKIETLNGKINQYLAGYATQQVVLYGSLSALLLLVGLLVAVYLSLRAKNRLNRELSMQKKETGGTENPVDTAEGTVGSTEVAVRTAFP